MLDDSPPARTAQEVGNTARILAGLLRSGASLDPLRDEADTCSSAALRLKRTEQGVRLAALDSLINLFASFTALGDGASVNTRKRLHEGLLAAADALDPVPRRESRSSRQMRARLQGVAPQQRGFSSTSSTGESTRSW